MSAACNTRDTTLSLHVAFAFFFPLHYSYVAAALVVRPIVDAKVVLVPEVQQFADK